MAFLWTLFVYFVYAIIPIAIAVKIYLVVTMGRYKIRKSLHGKVIVITGGTAGELQSVDGYSGAFLTCLALPGTGKGALQELAAAGATLHVLARDLSKAESVVSEIKALTGNQNITIHKVDLNDFSTVRAFADAFLATKSPLHVLINNAGLSKIFAFCDLPSAIDLCHSQSNEKIQR